MRVELKIPAFIVFSVKWQLIIVVHFKLSRSAGQTDHKAGEDRRRVNQMVQAGRVT